MSFKRGHEGSGGGVDTKITSPRDLAIFVALTPSCSRLAPFLTLLHSDTYPKKFPVGCDGSVYTDLNGSKGLLRVQDQKVVRGVSDKKN